jgi:hypothetical protein
MAETSGTRRRKFDYPDLLTKLLTNFLLRQKTEHHLSTKLEQTSGTVCSNLVLNDIEQHPGYQTLKAEIGGSNPPCATKLTIHLLHLHSRTYP